MSQRLRLHRVAKQSAKRVSHVRDSAVVDVQADIAVSSAPAAAVPDINRKRQAPELCFNPAPTLVLPPVSPPPDPDRVKTPTLFNRNSPWTSFSFWERSSITACGIPNLKMNDHPLGLAHVIFDNCVVKVREGFDLKNLLSLGRLGDVELFNVTSFGWVATDRTLLPCCIYERWISDMGAAVI
jgi:hypothetical protein